MSEARTTTGKYTHPTARKDRSMQLQKDMIANHYKKLSGAQSNGDCVAYTFVPGNLTELMLAFDILPVYPEINSLQSAMRGKTADYIREAEKVGHSEDVCSYVKSDIGMLMEGNIGPTGQPLPEPDVLLLSYTGCFTFMKWFENLAKVYEKSVPLMVHVPYQGDGEITDDMRTYVVNQLKQSVIPKLEEITGKAYDEDKLKELLTRSAKAEDDLVWTLESAKHRPSPIDAYFGAVYYVGPMFNAFRGTADAVKYYASLRREVEDRIAQGKGPITPDGEIDEENYRLVFEGPPNWTHFRDFWKIFSDEGAVAVASTYTKVGGVYDRGFRHDPDRPLETLAEYCMGCYTNMNLPDRVKLLEDYINEYEADGFVINSIKSCNSFSAGQLLMLRELENRTKIPGGFIESDLVDPRYYSQANIKNRIESYLQMIEQRRSRKEV
jgi:benzoyl-CoA reductase subunit B